MAFDESTLQSQLTQIQAAITAALTNPRPNWKVGHVSMDQNSYLKSLFDQQQMLIDQLKSIPAEVMVTTQNQIDQFGVDMTQYHDEPVS